MADERLIESENLKQSIMEVALNRLGSCEEFKKNIGDRRFIKKQFNKFLEKAYWGENIKTTSLGDYTTGENYICIYAKEENKELEQVKLHEAIHCILSKQDGKNATTGMLKIKDGKYIGMGLNEGLTEWIVEKAGILNSNIYNNEKRIAKQLETKFGADSIMRIAKGDIERDIPKILEMSKEDCETFIMKIDLMHNLQMHSIEMSEQIQKLELITDKTNDDNNQLEYLIDARRENLKNIIRQKYQIEDKIYNLYFKDDINMLNDMENISPEQAKEWINKFDNYYKIVFSGAFNRYEDKEFYEEMDFLTNTKLLNCGSDLANRRIDMLEQYQQVRSKLGESILENTLEKIENKTIKSKEFDENLRLFINSEEFELIARKLLPNDSKNIDKIAEMLRYEKSPSKVLENGTFYTLKTDEKTVLIYLDSEAKQIALDEASKKQDELIDFTLPQDWSFQKTMENVNKFIEKVKQNQPQAKINVINRAVVIENKGQRDFYRFEGEDIKNARIINQEKVNLKFNDERSIMVIPEKNSIFTRLSNLLKRTKTNFKFKEVKKLTEGNDFKTRLEVNNYKYPENYKSKDEEIDNDLER